MNFKIDYDVKNNSCVNPLYYTKTIEQIILKNQLTNAGDDDDDDDDDNVSSIDRFIFHLFHLVRNNV